MVRLIIVDDEKKTRESIEKYIPWNEIGVDEIRTAKNGLDALEISSIFPPDILLSDVRMPKMDGIELAKIIRNRFPSCKLIFLSGFADKEYLKSAIQLKALQYIEKPVNIEEIKKTVIEAVTLTHEEQGKKNEESRNSTRLSQSMPLLGNEITLALISSASGILEPTTLNHLQLLRFPSQGLFTCASALLDWSIFFSEEAKNAKFSAILHMLSDEFNWGSSNLLAGFKPKSAEVILVFASTHLDDSNQINLVFSNIFKKLQVISEGSYTVSLGVGKTVQKITDIHKSYLSALDSSKQSFYEGFGKLFSVNAPLKDNYDLDNNFRANFQDLLKKDIPAVEKLINSLTSQLIVAKNVDPDIIRNIYSSLLLDAVNTAQSLMLLNSSMQAKMARIFQDLDKHKTLLNLSKAILEFIQSMFVSKDLNDTPNRKVQDIIKYIHQHYSNPLLNIQMIADHNYLNQTYLCTLFKKITGKTLNDYINKTRIDKAKQFLKDSNIKMYELAELTGFSDPNYFAIIFKKYAGCTPSQYRNNIPV